MRLRGYTEIQHAAQLAAQMRSRLSSMVFHLKSLVEMLWPRGVGSNSGYEEYADTSFF